MVKKIYVCLSLLLGLGVLVGCDSKDEVGVKSSQEITTQDGADGGNGGNGGNGN